MKDKKIGVLLGGLGPEREISLKTGEAIYEVLKARGYDVHKVFVDSDIDRVLRQDPIDVAFNALHGTYGEDGCIQGLLEWMGVPYTGAGVMPSALAMDKVKSKELFRLYNVPTPPYYHVNNDPDQDLARLHGSFGFPVFVKPRHGGSSVAAAPANSVPELQQRIEDVFALKDTALVERMIKGREVAVGVLDGQALGAIEIAPKGEFYDYKSKYQKGQSEYLFPARLTPTQYKNVLHLAERSVKCVEAPGATRVDFLVTDDANEYVLEVNTLPGMTPTSLLPKIAKHAGMDFGDLCEAILERARLHVGDGMPSSEGVGSSLPVEIATTTPR